MNNFWQAQIMTQAAIEQLTGQLVNPLVLSIHPTGNLLHILMEKPPEEYSGIIIPDTLQGSGEQMGVGWIIAAGPRAGHSDYAASTTGVVGVIAGSDVNAPACLLGLHVIVGSHSGMPLRVDMLDREFRSAVLVLPTRDIKGVDTNQKSLTERVVEKSKEGRENFKSLARQTVEDSKEILKELE